MIGPKLCSCGKMEFFSTEFSLSERFCCHNGDLPVPFVNSNHNYFLVFFATNPLLSNTSEFTFHRHADKNSVLTNQFSWRNFFFLKNKVGRTLRIIIAETNRQPSFISVFREGWYSLFLLF